eukprot:4254264-Pleurochrysis_carterae.AAC.4
MPPAFSAAQRQSVDRGRGEGTVADEEKERRILRGFVWEPEPNTPARVACAQRRQQSGAHWLELRNRGCAASHAPRRMRYGSDRRGARVSKRPNREAAESPPERLLLRRRKHNLVDTDGGAGDNGVSLSKRAQPRCESPWKHACPRREERARKMTRGRTRAAESVACQQAKREDGIAWRGREERKDPCTNDKNLRRDPT